MATGFIKEKQYFYKAKFFDKRYLSEADWYSFGARYCDPVLGRWHSQDPLTVYASPYNGIGNNPVNLIDRWGMCPGSPENGGGGGGGYSGVPSWFGDSFAGVYLGNCGGYVTGSQYQDLTYGAFTSGNVDKYGDVTTAVRATAWEQKNQQSAVNSGASVTATYTYYIGRGSWNEDKSAIKVDPNGNVRVYGLDEYSYNSDDGFLNFVNKVDDYAGVPSGAFAMRISDYLKEGYYVNAKGALRSYTTLSKYKPGLSVAKQPALSKAFVDYRAFGKTLGMVSHGIVFTGLFLDFAEYQTSNINSAELSFRYTATGIGLIGGPIGLGISAFILLGPPPSDPSTQPNAVKHDWGWEYVCFKKGTLIHSESGFVEIQDLKVGTKVYSYNVDKDSIELRTVIKSFERKTNEIYKLQIDNEEIYVTGEHPFYLLSEGWTKVKDLKVNDLLKTESNLNAKISQIQKVNDQIPVYNIHVDGNNNYFVSKIGILVHNK